MPANTPDDVLHFWFGAPDRTQTARDQWFRKSPAFDAEIRDRFLATHADAIAGRLDSWQEAPRSALALVVVLDQFSRNLFRDSPAAFSADPKALALARHLVEAGWDRQLTPLERGFVYLPFEHSESLDAQDEALRLFADLRQFPETSDLHAWAEKHHRVIARFGRFPHRNAVLGRVSTDDELAFLKEPGSRF
jgi:uncharacterized protein (DUF924 family)